MTSLIWMDITAAIQHNVLETVVLKPPLRLVPNDIAQAELRQAIVLCKHPQLILCAIHVRPAGLRVPRQGIAQSPSTDH